MHRPDLTLFISENPKFARLKHFPLHLQALSFALTPIK
jgi:hypothetical protein